MPETLETCPYCFSLCVVPIVYGKPAPELQRAAQRGLLTLGGCVVDADHPDRHCLDCESRWRKQASSSDRQRRPWSSQELRSISDRWFGALIAVSNSAVNSAMDNEEFDWIESRDRSRLTRQLFWEAGSFFGNLSIAEHIEGMAIELDDSEISVVIEKEIHHLDGYISEMCGLAGELGPMLRNIDQYESAQGLVNELRHAKQKFISVARNACDLVLRIQ